MKAVPYALLMVLLAASLVSCGSKSSETATTTETGSTMSTPAATSTPAPETLASVPSGPPPDAKSKYDDGPRASAKPVNAAMAAEGKTLFTNKGCVTCHAFGKKLIGPDLTHVASQRSAEWMEQQILHPEVMIKEDPISHALLVEYKVPMTNQHLTPEEAKKVIEYLKQQDKQQ